MLVAGIAFGFVIGLALGLLGGGGSILTVPIFVYVLGFGAKPAIGMSLGVVGMTSLVGAAGHWRAGHVNGRLAVAFGAIAMVGTYVGTQFATLVSGRVQLTVFATTMLVAAAFMFRRRAGNVEEAATGDVDVTRLGLVMLRGLGVGLLTGLVGVGGGFLIVPALVWGGVPMRDAVGTSLLIIAMNCAVGFYGYLGQIEIAWLAVALVTLGTVPGIAAGTYAIGFIAPGTLRRGFAVFLVGIATYMLLRPHAA